MLIACSKCRRQYDVTGIRPGEQIRCVCGELQEVPALRVHEARTLHCSSCGGKLRSDAGQCDYCGCEIAADDRHLGDACPECYARLSRGAKYCRECGVAIRPERIQTTRANASCPRCRGQLVLCTVAGGSHYTECSGCGGMWLEEGMFDSIVEERDTSAIGKYIAGERERSTPTATTDVVKYLPCPTCGQLMNRKNFGGSSGVIIDWCKGHGYWFDTYELEKIIHFVADGGLDRARQHEIDRQKREIDRNRRAARKSAEIAAAMRGGPAGGRPVLTTGLDPIGLPEVVRLIGGALRALFLR